MEISLTTNVTHQSNGEYPCILVQFTDEDKHFYPDKRNWMPKDYEVKAIYKLFMKYSPSFREMMKDGKD